MTKVGNEIENLFSQMCVCFFFFPQVGSFNYAIDKMVFHDVFLPEKENAVKSVLDYDITISKLK